MNLTARGLYARLAKGEPTFVLDVRAPAEFERWRLEGPTPVDAVNVPYTRMLADADEEDIPGAAAAYVSKNMAGMIPKSPLVVAVCAKGGASAFIADGLRSLGYDAVNLEGGMIAWGEHYEVLPILEGAARTVLQVARPARGCLSWVVLSEGEAVVIDPLRHVDRYSALLAEYSARLVAVVDTHAHADHVSGGRRLAARHEASYYLHPYDAIHPMDVVPATFDFRFLHEASRIEFGGASLVALHVPGHTLGTTALLLDDGLLFAGDTLFIDSIARPDLGGQAERWTPLHHASLRRLLGLGGDVLALPGHFASPREAGPGGAFTIRMRDLLARNDGARRALADPEGFERYILSSLPVFPPQYVEIKRVNLGLASADEARLVELELGKNVCALAAHHGP